MWRILAAVGPVKATDIGIPKVTVDGALLAKIASGAFVAIGGVALLFVIIGAFRYVASNGDAKQAALAKNTILYALVGMIISASAFGIIQFLLGSIL